MIKSLSFTKQAPDLATPESLAAVESKFNLHFPSALVEFCCRWNGGFTHKNSEFYPVPLAFKEYYDEFGPRDGGVLVDTLFGTTRELMECSWFRNETILNEHLNYGIMPIGVNLFGNYAVLRTDEPDGPVCWWDHELWEKLEGFDFQINSNSRPRLIPIAENLEFFYNSLTSDPDRKK